MSCLFYRPSRLKPGFHSNAMVRMRINMMNSIPLVVTGMTLMHRSVRKARFPFKHNRLRCVRCVNENRKKLKRLRWQAANHGCHRFDRAFLLAGACVCCVNNANACVSCGFRLRNSRNARNASDCV